MHCSREKFKLFFHGRKRRRECCVMTHNLIEQCYLNPIVVSTVCMPRLRPFLFRELLPIWDGTYADHAAYGVKKGHKGNRSRAILKVVMAQNFFHLLPFVCMVLFFPRQMQMPSAFYKNNLTT